ncbi:hypothetical protein ACFL6W_07805 [Thermodesulfobacteriota bacterium]
MKTKITLILVMFLSLIVFVGCNEPKGEFEQRFEDLLVLKSYEVPEKLSKEISQDLNNLLYFNEPRIGRATLSPDGQLLVVAPKNFHTGVKDIIEQIKKNNPDPSPSVEVNYWIVAGRKAESPAKLDEFGEIYTALGTIQNTQGNMEFKLLDRVVVTSSSKNTQTRLGGADVSIKQTVSAFGDGSLVIISSIKMSNAPRSIIETELETRSGELVVLGQLSQEFYGRPIFEHAKDVKKHTELVNVYYIISARVKK